MSEYEITMEKLEDVRKNCIKHGDVFYSPRQVIENTRALLQKYHDALVRLGDAEPMVARDFEKMSPMEWEVLEKRVRRRYANKVLESEG